MLCAFHTCNTARRLDDFHRAFHYFRRVLWAGAAIPHAQSLGCDLSSLAMAIVRAANNLFASVSVYANASLRVSSYTIYDSVCSVSFISVFYVLLEFD